MIHALGWFDRGQHEQGQQDLGERERHVVEAHDHLVPPAARVGRDHADQGADHHPEDGAEDRDVQDRRAAVHEPGEDVLSEVVGAEQALVAERWADDLVLAVRCEQRSEEGDQHDGDGDDQAHDHALLLESSRCDS